MSNLLYKTYKIKKDDTEIEIKVVEEHEKSNGAKVFKIILENSDKPSLIRDMYDNERQKWINNNSETYKRCSEGKKNMESYDSFNKCMNTPNFYGELVVDSKDIIVAPDATPAAPSPSAFHFPLFPPTNGGTRRRRRNNKKSKRKSKNNRKKTNRRR